MGLIQNVVVLKQLQNEIKSKCKNCGKIISYSKIKENGNYTKLCACGCEVNTLIPATNEKPPYYVVRFISKAQYNPNYQKMDSIEKLGYTKKGKKYVRN